MKKKTNNVSLTSKNPAYNPYHPSLIHVKSNYGSFDISILGAPYKENKIDNFKLTNSEK